MEVWGNDDGNDHMASQSRIPQKATVTVSRFENLLRVNLENLDFQIYDKMK